MIRSEFASRKENTKLGIIACAVLCFAAYAINPVLGIAIAATIAAGVLLLGGKNLVAGMTARL